MWQHLLRCLCGAVGSLAVFVVGPQSLLDLCGDGCRLVVGPPSRNTSRYVNDSLRCLMLKVRNKHQLSIKKEPCWLFSQGFELVFCI